MIDILIFLVIGALVGWLAGKIMKTKFSILGNIIVGVVGGVLGGWVFGLLGLACTSMIGSFIASVVGALLLIFIIKRIRK